MSAPASNSILIVGGNRGIGFGLVEESVGQYFSRYVALGDLLTRVEQLKRDSTTTVFATARDPEKADALTMLVKQYPSRLTVLKLDMLDESSVMVRFSTVKLSRLGADRRPPL